MTFEKDFPSLAEKDKFGESTAKHLELQGWSEIIQRHCLDKQKVREWIEKVFVDRFNPKNQGDSHGIIEVRMILDKLKKELGLK